MKICLLHRWGVGCLLGLLLVACSLSATAQTTADDDGDGIEAIARTSKDVTFSFTRPGRVAEVLVEQGQMVSAGDVLVQLDNSVERERVARLKKEAESTLHVAAAEANMKLKDVVLQRKETGFTDGVVTILELEEARVDATIGKLSYDLAKFNQELATLQYTEAQLEIKRMTLISNLDGIVETLFIEEGESVDAQAEVVRVVDIDPLWVDVPTTLDRALQLQVGQAAEARFCQTCEQTPESAMTGKIVLISAVADAASDTLMVRVELANPEHAPAGQRVLVRFLPAVEGAAKLTTKSISPDTVGGAATDNASE